MRLIVTVRVTRHAELQQTATTSATRLSMPEKYINRFHGIGIK